MSSRATKSVGSPPGSLPPRATPSLYRPCGLPVEAVAPSLAAFEQDSQANTQPARDVKADPLSEAQLAGLLARYPGHGGPDLRPSDITSR